MLTMFTVFSIVVYFLDFTRRWTSFQLLNFLGLSLATLFSQYTFNISWIHIIVCCCLMGVSRKTSEQRRKQCK